MEYGFIRLTLTCERSNGKRIEMKEHMKIANDIKKIIDKSKEA